MLAYCVVSMGHRTRVCMAVCMQQYGGLFEALQLISCDLGTSLQSSRPCFLISLIAGVPKSRRGEIWQFLALQYRLRHRLPNKQQPPDISYKELLKQLTAQQHAILVDLGMSAVLILIYESKQQVLSLSFFFFLILFLVLIKIICQSAKLLTLFFPEGISALCLVGDPLNACMWSEVFILDFVL